MKGAGCAARLASNATGPAGSRVVDAVGWETAQAAAAAAAPEREHIEHLPLGTRTDETWLLVVEPVQEVGPCCSTFAAIRKLVAIARTLDDYRRDEKQRAALWPAEALDGDSECLWISEQSPSSSIARRIASAPVPILLTGETGTGKEMLARVIHRASRPRRPPAASRSTAPRCRATCSRASCSATARARSPAPTSAFPGVIRAAAGGTLFLDEIGDIGLDVQPKLLRFLETHEIHPLGEPQPVTVDVRIIAATNANLEQLVARRPLPRAICSTASTSSSCTCRRCASAARRSRRSSSTTSASTPTSSARAGSTLSDETLEYLLLYSWPGNIRQLANEIRRMMRARRAGRDADAGAAVAGHPGLAPHDRRAGPPRARDPPPPRSAAAGRGRNAGADA